MTRMLTAAAIGMLLVSQAFAGVLITSVMKGEGESREKTSEQTTRVKIDGDKAKIEWVEGRNPSGEKDGYMLTTDGGKTLYMVNPSEKTYMKWDMEKMMQMAGGMMQAMKGFMDVKITEYKVEKALDEAGPAILGYPTRHYKFVTRFTTETTVFGRKQTSASVNEQEIWSTTKFRDAGFAVFEKMVPQRVGFADVDKVIEAERTKGMKGIPLKVITTTNSGTTEKPRLSKATMEVTELKETGIAASEFAIPKDYTEQKLDVPQESEPVEKPKSRGGRSEDEPAAGSGSKNNPPGLDGLLKMFRPPAKSGQ
jgi:hypothetical protein